MHYLKQYLNNQVALNGFTGAKAEGYRQQRKKLSVKKKKQKQKNQGDSMEGNNESRGTNQILALLGAGGLFLGGIWYWYNNRETRSPHHDDISELEDKTGDKITGKSKKEQSGIEGINLNNMPKEVARNVKIMNDRGELD